MKKSSSSSRLKVIILSVVLIFGFYIQSKIGNPETFAERILGESGKSESSIIVTGNTYTTAEQDSLKKKFAGYWIFSGEEIPGVHFDDYIELLDNGIVWEYERRVFSFPYGAKDTIIRVSNAYLLPNQPADSNSSACFLRLIRQNWQIAGVFCYGPSQLILQNAYAATAERSDIVTDWTASRKDDSTMVFNGNPYKKYTGELTKFFPDQKAVPSVDDPSVMGCADGDPHIGWVRENIIKAIKNQEIEPNTVPVEQKLNLQNFYIPYCFEYLKIFYGTADGETLTMKLTVAADGAITAVKLSGKPVDVSPGIEDQIESEILQWKVHGTGAESEITVSTKVKSRV